MEAVGVRGYGVEWAWVAGFVMGATLRPLWKVITIVRDYWDWRDLR